MFTTNSRKLSTISLTLSKEEASNGEEASSDDRGGGELGDDQGVGELGNDGGGCGGRCCGCSIGGGGLVGMRLRRGLMAVCDLVVNCASVISGAW